MNFIVWAVSMLVLITKYLDCQSTSSQITNLNQEKNPVSRYIMKKFGIKNAIWGIFILSIILVSFSIWLLFEFFDKTLYKLIFIILALSISTAQILVVYTNITKKPNFFTKFLMKIYIKPNIPNLK